MNNQPGLQILSDAALAYVQRELTRVELDIQSLERTLVASAGSPRSPVPRPRSPPVRASPIPAPRRSLLLTTPEPEIQPVLADVTTEPPVIGIHVTEHSENVEGTRPDEPSAFRQPTAIGVSQITRPEPLMASSPLSLVESLNKAVAESLAEQMGATNRRVDELSEMINTRCIAPGPKTTTPQEHALNPAAPEFHYNQPVTMSASEASLSVARELRKPTAVITKFSGDPLKYVSFLRQFNTRISQNTESYDEKINYLIQFTDGEARKIAEGYSHLEASVGFAAAMDEFQKRYGDPEVVAQAYVNKALNWPTVDGDDASALDAFGIFLRECQFAIHEIDAVRVLEYSENLKRLVGKLPLRLHDRWRTIAIDTKDKGHPVRFSQLVEFVRREAKKANDPVYGKGALRDAKMATKSQPKREKERPVPKPRSHMRSSTDGTTSRTLLNTTAPPTPMPRKPQQQSHEGQANRQCPVCQGDHLAARCPQFLAKGIDERYQCTRALRLCLNCLRPFHQIKDCLSKVRCREGGCGGTHHTLLHRPAEDSRSTGKETSETVSNNNTGHDTDGTVLFQLIPVYACSNGRSIPTVAVLDSASQITIINESLARELGLKGKAKRMTINTMSSPVEKEARVVSFKLRSRDPAFTKPIYINDARSFDLESFQCAPQILDPTWEHCQGIGIPAKILPDQVQILIGADQAEAHIQTDIRRGSGRQPLAVCTSLGWALMGRDTSDDCSSAQVNLMSERALNLQVEDFWRTEAFGTKHNFERSISTEDRRAMETLEDKTKLIDGHYTVPMLWRDENVTLPNNYQAALRRFNSLERRLLHDGEFGQLYRDTLNGYVERGYARKMSPEEASTTSQRTWYLPHHGVTNPNKPGKVRVVFDAAAQFRGVSLNDVLLTGPDLLNNLFGVLQRFRLFDVAIVGDVEAMFHQVRVPPEDADSLRFLWKSDPTQPGPPDTYQMRVHIFGATDSPCCANFALQKTARDFGDRYSPEAVEAMQRDFYMDDLAKSVEGDEKAAGVSAEVVDMAAKAGFRVCKFVSNKRSVIEATDSSIKLIDFDDAEVPIQRTLGIRWDIQGDCLVFTCQPKDSPVTKRGVVSVVSSIFDPCGYITPFTIRAKYLIQELWRRNLDWDTPLPADLQLRWESWLDNLTDLKFFRLPRQHPDFTLNVEFVELHLFSDSSEMAFGAVAYLRYKTVDGVIRCSFLASKTRVAPLKTLSMPRLELQGAVLATRLGVTLREELHLALRRSVYWCDSKVVLQYIKNKSRRFKPFVANRTAEILDVSESGDWHYVPTDLNPADHCSRGLTAASLGPETPWFQGPAFLAKDESEWPASNNDDIPEIEDNDPEVKSRPETSVVHAVSTINPGNGGHTYENLAFADVTTLLNPAHFSTWQRLVRRTAWVQRAICNFASRVKGAKLATRQETNLSVEELEAATMQWVRMAQQDAFGNEIAAARNGEPASHKGTLSNLEPVYDESVGCLRVGGRLRKAAIPQDAKHQFILPHNHAVTRLIAADIHCRLAHCGQEQMIAELRRKFWPVRARNVAKQTISECLFCRRKRVNPIIPRMADLPPCRLTVSSGPFFHCGVDYFGPMLVKVLRTRQKRWGCLFTCLSTRAIHLELAGSLETDDFILCLRNFVGRRGHPEHMYSDNGTNFRGAEAELARCLQSLEQNRIQGLLAPQGITWHFNPPAAPHFGGAWERLVRSVKLALNAMLKDAVVTESVLQTALIEVEAVVNSRPLTHNSPDPTDYAALTPNHFLVGRADNKIPPDNCQDREINSRRRWRQAQVLADRIHRRWLQEYLPKLTARNRWLTDGRSISEGDLVMIVDDDLPRGQWELGRIIETYPGDDGRIRAADVKTPRNVFRRPVSKLCVLEENVQKCDG